MACGKNGAKLDKLFRSPLTFRTTARGKFDSHASGKSEIHKFSVMAKQNFLAAMRRQTAPLDQQLNRLMPAQIDENREKMKSIVKTVIFCGQNNIPLSGKRDDNPDDSNLQGNFQPSWKHSFWWKLVTKNAESTPVEQITLEASKKCTNNFFFCSKDGFRCHTTPILVFSHFLPVRCN